MTTPFTPKVSLATFYNAVMKPRGFALGPHHATICTALEDERIGRLMVISGPGNGKSTVTSTIYPAWLLGHRPETTILGVGAAEDLMQKFAKGTAEIIADAAPFRRIFPAVKPDRKTGWSPQGGFNVTGRPPGDPDASYLGVGLASKALTGKHARLLILDDLHDKENSTTADGCAKVIDAYYTTLEGRADARGVRTILSGRRFNTADIYGHFIDSGDWVVMILPAERRGETRLWWDVLVPKQGENFDGPPIPCVFSETLRPHEVQDPNSRTVAYRAYYGLDPNSQGFYWPGNKAKHAEYYRVKRNAPFTAEAVYQCNPNARENAVFIDSDFCFDHPLNGLPLQQGISDPSVAAVIEQLGGEIVQAWDTGFGKSADSAYSVCVTALLVPYKEYWRGEDRAILGEPDRHNRVFVLDVHREKMDFSQLTQALRSNYRKWGARMVLVENRASGISLIQTLTSSGIPLRAVEAKQGKVVRAVDAVGGGAGSVQGWFRQHRVVFPRQAPWLAAYINEFKDFAGELTTTKDQVDATVYLVAYAIQRSIGMVRLPSDEVMAEAAKGSIQKQQDNLADLMAFLTSEQVDVGNTTCARCKHFEAGQSRCKKFGFATPSIGTCDHFEPAAPA